ncbi:MAG: tRNA uridine-5-carboxymethylaminomethyl(34) synthesis GTPase MnmE [Anaerolineae bacterium]
MYSLDDTIAAIATPLGQGGVGIVKLSGPEALPIAQGLFHPARPLKRLRPRYLHFGQLIDPADNSPVDEILLAYMPGPHSYTRQDVVEIQAHGGLAPLQRILQLVLAAGARPAEAGEFTLRAFINGRLDLAQAEAVLDVVEAKTEAALRVATEQLGGALSARVKEVRRGLVDVLAFLEASIDFVEDEIPPQDVARPLQAASNGLEGLIASADRGLIYRQGARAAIVGKPNVGKSSLLNALLRNERAIVTDIPGTTRDTLEETINVGGVPLVLVDTAGIRAHAVDAVEHIGIERSRAALARADLALLVVDGTAAPDEGDEQIAALISSRKPALLIINKRDLPGADPGNIPAGFCPGSRRIFFSAASGQGLEALEAAIIDTVLGGALTLADAPLVSNPRHKALLTTALGHVESALEAHGAGLSVDLVAIDVREAVEALGQITGETASEDLLNAIFSNFCIGK